MADRRQALKIIGAIGTTCAFPFAGDELYGQHVHPPAGAQVEPEGPRFFAARDYAIISRIADLIIPATDTPGAVAAGVPRYIDEVVGRNAEHQKVFRAGIDWLQARDFRKLPEAEQIALLTLLSNAVDA